MRDSSAALAGQLAIVATVSRQPGIRLDDLARQFGVSPKQMRREIEVIDRAGHGDLLPDKTFSLDYDRLVQRGEVVLFDDLSVASSPRLTATETASILFGLEAVAGSLDPQAAQDLPELVAALLALSEPPQVDPATSAASAAATPSGSVPSDPVLGGASSARPPVAPPEPLEPGPYAKTFAQVRMAILARRQLNIRYVSRNGAESRRDIDPIRLIRIYDGWLVRAWCHHSAAQRTFRLDGIVHCESLSDKWSHPRLASRADASDPEDVCVVVLTPAAAWMAAELPAECSVRDTGELEVRLTIWDEAWLRGQLLRLAPWTVSVSPERFAAAVQGDASRALSRWDDLGAAS